MIFKYAIVTFLLIGSFFRCLADEGMWIPLLLGKYNYEDMKKKGFRLTPEDIYSINNASMKDAVVIFGRGCTAELISEQGLIMTNHHCGYGAIQAHSSLEHDYLTDGFWAMSNQEELTCPGLSVTFLVRMEDVTSQVLADVLPSMSEAERQAVVQKVASKITKDAVEGTKYEAVIKPFFFGNEYYLFIYEVFRDIRLVGAPPSGIGKFGGDTDNWVWPRHTGDFSVFRIYADKDNQPAEYAAGNVPYKPKKYFPISMKGIKEGDFTMVFGYPGRTSEYLTSWAVEMTTKKDNPQTISLREKVLEIMNTDMTASNLVRIQYSNKYAGVANYWKKWIGENRGLDKADAIEKKKELEQKFASWAVADPEKKTKYGTLLENYEMIYKELAPYSLAMAYIEEAGFAPEIIEFAGKFERLLSITDPASDESKKTIESLKKQTTSFFKNFNLPTDKKIFVALLKMYQQNMDKNFLPMYFSEIETKYKGDFVKYADYVYGKSVFSTEEKTLAFLDNWSSKKAKTYFKDPAYLMNLCTSDLYLTKLRPVYIALNSKLDSLNRIYINGLREMQQDKIFYPDANFTLRISYGQVKGYQPNDAVRYNWFTTLDGIMEKDNPEIYDYNVPAKLREVYNKKDYGPYAVNGTVPVAFIATNHTSGGNSGSPVVDGDGNLIGVNFDRCWEGTMSDIMYDPEQCRNIVLDIRYALFVIDKVGGASYLLKEMSIIN